MTSINTEIINNKDTLSNKLKDCLKELDLLLAEFIPIDDLYYKYVDEDEYKKEFKEINTTREYLINKIKLVHLTIDELEKSLEFNM